MSDPRFTVHVTEEMIRHSRILDILYFSGFLYGIVELLLILFLGISTRLRDAAARLSQRPYVIAILYVVLFTIVTAVIEFPLSYYAGFIVPHQFHLTHQTFGAWIGDEAKALAIGLVFSVIVIPPALLLIRKFKRWWLWLSIAAIPLTILLVVIAPVVVDPVFNKFEPLKDQVLKQKLLDQAARAGIEGSRVYQVDKSKQTTTMNAYVTGLGPSKRIVMWDTLLAKLNQDEVLATMGHEMGHYVLHHVWKGTFLTILGTFAVLFFAQRIYEWGLPRWRWTSGDPASLPWLLIIIAAINFLGSPVQNGISRYIEHEADVFGLDLTHLNEATASSFVKFAEDSKVNPNPSPFIEFWRYSHPSVQKRIDFALHYKPLTPAPRTSSPSRPTTRAATRTRAEATSRSAAFLSRVSAGTACCPGEGSAR